MCLSLPLSVFKALYCYFFSILKKKRMAEFPHTTGYLLLLSAAVTLRMQMSFFCIAYLCQFDKVTDFAGASNFLLLAWLTYAIGTEDSDFNTRKFVITICITLWSVRLGSYLLYRGLQRGSDQRFEDLRGKFFSFLGFWILQFVWVFLVSLPVITVNGSTENVDLGARDYIGWALFVIGFIIESWADNSKSIFVANREQKKRKSRDKARFECTRRNQNYNIWPMVYLETPKLFWRDNYLAWHISFKLFSL